MVEVTLSDEPDPAAVSWLKQKLAELDALPSSPQSGIAGSVEATWQSFRLRDGTTIEIWSDSYSALSLRGDAPLVEALLAEFRGAQ